MPARRRRRSPTGPLAAVRVLRPPLLSGSEISRRLLRPPSSGGASLHRGLDALAVAADAQGVARAVEAPVLGVVVGVGEPLRPLVRRRARRPKAALPASRLSTGDQGIELPLDLLVVEHPSLHGLVITSDGAGERGELW